MELAICCFLTSVDSQLSCGSFLSQLPTNMDHTISEVSEPAVNSQMVGYKSKSFSLNSVSSVLNLFYFCRSKQTRN